MDLKTQIENELKSLKSLGWTRRKIEQELDYGEKYLDQTISKGGTKPVLTRLRLLHKSILQDPKVVKPTAKAIPTGAKVVTMDDYINRIEGEVDWLRKIIEDKLISVESGVSTSNLSLNRMERNQEDELSMIKGGIAQLEDIAAKVLNKPIDQVRGKTNKVVSGIAKILKKTGNSAEGSPGKG